MTIAAKAHIDWCIDPTRADVHNADGECVRPRGILSDHRVRATAISAGPCGYVAQLKVEGVMTEPEQVDELIEILREQKERLAVARAVWECECDTDECQNQP